MTTPRSFRAATRSALATTLVAAALVSGAGSAAQAAEVGPDDLRVSSMGPDTTAGYEAQQSKIAYDADNQQFLVVWRGDDENDGQTEIYGQLLDATTGATVLADDLLIARIGTVGDATTNAVDPAVAWNSTTGDFVVVYAADDTADTPPIMADTYEIYAQRVTGAGVVSGTPLRVSDMGASDTAGSFDARFPDIAYDPDTDQFLVVWQGDDDTAPLVDNETEIFGQLIDATAGAEVGPNDVRLSDMGADGATATDARHPAVAYDTANATYLVVWEGNDDAAAVTDFAIHGQLVSPALVETGTDFAISRTTQAFAPDIAVDTNAGQFLVGWQGETGVVNEFEVYTRLVTAAGVVGTGTRISTMGPDGDTSWIANAPAIAYDEAADQYVLVWTGDDDSGSAVNDHFEVYSQRLTSAGALTGGMERLSTMGDETVPSTAVTLPDIAYSNVATGHLGVVWSAENPPTTVAGEAEIWAQLVAPVVDLAVTGTVTPTNATPGTPVTFDFVYENVGEINVDDVLFTSFVPEGLSDVTTGWVTWPQPDATRVDGDWISWRVDEFPVGATHTVEISGVIPDDAPDGDLDLPVTVSSANLKDPLANNSITLTVAVDAVPSVTIEQAAGQDDPATTSPVDFTVEFSEPVTGFETGDVTLSGTAGATTATVTGSGTTYNVAVSGMTADGSIIASIAAGVANDADQANAANTASTSTDNSVDYDATVPTVTIDKALGQSDPTNGSTVDFTVEFSEPVIGFDATDVTLSGTAGATTAVVTAGGTPTTYDVEVSGMTSEGTVVASIAADAASDAAGNGNTASTSTDNTVVVDTTAPTASVTLAAGQATPTNVEPIVFTVDVDEAVTGFDVADVTLSGTAGATTVTVTPDGDDYTLSVTGLTGDGTVIVTIGTTGVADLAGNAAATPDPATASATYIAGDPDPLVNDAPVITAPATGAVELGDAFTFAGGVVTVSDVDALDADLNVTITAAGATISVGDTTALTSATGGGDSPLVLTGDLASLDAVLATVSVTPAAIGDTTVALSIDDLGNTPGPAATDTADIVLTVTDTVDPVITTPGTITVSADPGEPGATVTFAVSVDDNGATTSASASALAAFLNASAPLVADGDLVCTPASGSFFPDRRHDGHVYGHRHRRQHGVVVVPRGRHRRRGAGHLGSRWRDCRDHRRSVRRGRLRRADGDRQLRQRDGHLHAAAGIGVPARVTTISCTADDGNGNTASVAFPLTVTSSILPATGGGLDAMTLAVQFLALGLLLFGISRRRRLA